MTIDEFDQLVLSQADLADHKDLLVSYARGMHCAQLLEVALKCLLISLHGDGRLKTKPSDLVDNFACYNNATLGRLTKVLEGKVKEDLSVSLRTALALRNALAHTFFIRKARKFREPSTSKSFQQELDRHTQELWTITKRVMVLVGQYFEKIEKRKEYIRTLAGASPLRDFK